jgi:hypothetical protein
MQKNPLANTIGKSLKTRGCGALADVDSPKLGSSFASALEAHQAQTYVVLERIYF